MRQPMLQRPALHVLFRSRLCCVIAALMSVSLSAAALSSQETVASLVAQVGPAVVSVRAYGAGNRLMSEGSGFRLEDGRVVTNWHVVRGAVRVEVIGSDGVSRGQTDVAEVADAAADLAILPAMGSGEPGIPLADDLPLVGTRIVVIGAPEGLTNTVSDGLISAVREMEGRELVQISAPISSGSSGGPVLDMAGRVLGVAVSTLRTGQNLNFAVPVRSLRSLSSTRAEPLPFATAANRSITSSNSKETIERRLAPGQQVTQRLEASDRRMSDRSFFDEWYFDANAGATVTVTMTSTDFDTYLILGRMVDGEFVRLAYDDDAGDGSNSRIRYRITTNGEYVIRANSYGGGAIGTYVLFLERR